MQANKPFPVLERGDSVALIGYLGRRFEIIRVDNQGNGIVHLVLVRVDNDSTT